MTREQLTSLKGLAKSLNYGSGPAHSKQVEKLSLKIYRELIKSKLLVTSTNDRLILSAAALLHNIGLPSEPHNKVAFDILVEKIPGISSLDSLPPQDLSAILYCVLWHRGNKFKKRAGIKISQQSHTKKLASIVRVADALDRSFQQIVEDVTLKSADNSLEFIVKSKPPADEERERAAEKADLMKEAFDLQNVSFK